MINFNIGLFDSHFKTALSAIAKAEKVTKETLRELSREVLSAVHATGDIAYVNRLNEVLTPVNRKVAVLYFKDFTGFTYDADEQAFGKKSKKHYDAALDKCLKFLEDPHNNIWTWAEKNIDVEKKPLDLSKITAFIKNAIKKAGDEGIAQSEVLKAVFAAGVDVDSLIVAMEAMEGVDVNVKGEAENV